MCTEILKEWQIEFQSFIDEIGHKLVAKLEKGGLIESFKKPITDFDTNKIKENFFTISFISYYKELLERKEKLSEDISLGMYNKIIDFANKNNLVVKIKHIPIVTSEFSKTIVTSEFSKTKVEVFSFKVNDSNSEIGYSCETPSRWDVENPLFFIFAHGIYTVSK